MIGSFMQGVALALYLYFDGLTSLFVVSGIFGLFQGGIVPMYAVICRELLPPRQAGAAIGLVVSATIFGMAFGGYFSGRHFRPDQLLPDGVPERAPVQRVQFRHRRLALLAPAKARAGGCAHSRLNLGFLGPQPFRVEGRARAGWIVLGLLKRFSRPFRDFSRGCAAFQPETNFSAPFDQREAAVRTARGLRATKGRTAHEGRLS